MPAYVMDANIRVSFLTSCANTGAPTTAEINAGVALEGYVTSDGWQLDTSNDSVDVSVLNSAENFEDVGRRTDNPSLTMFDQGPNTVPATTFASNAAGFLVERRGVAASTAWAASQKVRVIPVKAKAIKRPQTAKNERDKIIVEFAKTGPIVDLATTA